MGMTKRRILYFTIILIIMIIMLVFCGVFINKARVGLYNEKLNYLFEISSKTAQVITKKINGDLLFVETLANYIDSGESLDIENMLNILSKEAERSLFKRMGIIMPDGTTYTTDNEVFDSSNREHFKKAMRGENNVSDCLVDLVDGKMINVYAAPIRRNNEILGVILATKSIEQFTNAIKIENFDGKGYTYIINSGGKPVIDIKNTAGIEETENFFELMSKRGVPNDKIEYIKRDINNKVDGSIEYVIDKEKKQMCYTKVGINDWYLLSVVPMNAISYQSDNLISNLSVLSTSFVLIVILVCCIVVHIFKKNNKTLEKLAYYDDITGYPNKEKFYIDVKNIFSKNTNNNYAMIMLDINKFKVINDVFGFREGNEFLKFLSMIIHNSISTNEAFCRVPADNFYLLMVYESDEVIINRIQTIINKAKSYFDTYKIEISAGIYEINDTSIDINFLCDRSNISKYIAKKQVDTWYHFFKEENRISILKEKEIENNMEYALQNSEFEIYLQPKISLFNQNIVGAEALVRWNMEGKGLVFPNEFIPIFESNGFIKKLDLYMFENVCKVLSRWKENSINFKVVPISVNISRVNLSDLNLATKLKKIALNYNIEPNLIEIELTESAIVSEINDMIEIITKIKDEGFLVSIDDFGIGYSSLSVIKNLPIDYVKIDKSFIDEIEYDKRGEKIISSIISMNRSLGISNVAEGVETQNQIDFLTSVGCDIVQGYFYSKPIKVHEFEKMINK